MWIDSDVINIFIQVSTFINEIKAECCLESFAKFTKVMVGGVAPPPSLM
jgi:hypothetical protein